jgi:hypothetical protein
MKILVAVVLCLLAGCGKQSDPGPSAPPPSNAPASAGESAFAAKNPAKEPKRKDPPKDPPVKRPHLVRQQGKYFAWSMPAGWQFNETANGVDVYAPDQKAGAGVAVVFNYPGQCTPRQALDTMVERAGIQSPETIRENDLPDAEGYGGIPWKIVEREFKYTYGGVKARQKATAGGAVVRERVSCGVLVLGVRVEALEGEIDVAGGGGEFGGGDESAAAGEPGQGEPAEEQPDGS